MIPGMVDAWIAVAAWLVAWTAQGWFSMSLLSKVRPGERVPLIFKSDGSGGWFVSPVAAAGLAPLLSVLAGAVTIGAAYMASSGRAPVMNVILAAVFVFTHGIYVRRAIDWLQKNR
jgi:hypothetical protein